VAKRPKQDTPWTLTVGDQVLPVHDLGRHYWYPTDLPSGVNAGPSILSYLTLGIRKVPESVMDRNRFMAVLSNRDGVTARGYAEVSKAESSRGRTWSVEFTFKPDRRADLTEEPT
jgi:hypothetical protein